MPILAVGLTYLDAPVEFRERLAIPPAELDEALDKLSEFVPEGVILSTCYRTEVYASVGHHASGLRALTSFLAHVNGLEEQVLSAHLRDHWQEATVRHLFRVAAGLDSMIIGEGQVLGQVREAFERAAKRRPIGAELSRLFNRALAVGKRARTETAIARNAVSVSHAAVDLARQALGGLQRSTVLVIGAGKMGELAARSLRERGAKRVILMNRTEQRADILVQQLGGEAWPLADLDGALRLADIVITSTTSEHYVITEEDVDVAIGERGGRALAIVDIAVPRDVEPTVASLPGVHLFNVDDLRDVCASNLHQRKREAKKVESIIEDEVAKYVRWWQAREVAPTIAALLRRAEAIRQDELARVLARLEPLSDRERNAINALTTAIVNKMLHDPITRLKERGSGLDGKPYVHAIRELFDLPPAELAVE
jgi:glutamyl-tRNA reductase